ncbi:MAG: endonuclease [Thermoleophilia bacterium]|nr:endonuclease [Thermoleophilia bacterium]
MNGTATIAALLERFGTTFAEEAGIALRDEPAPLFQLLVLCKLLGARIGTPQAVEAMRGVLDAGWTTPQHLANSSWRQRVTVLNRNGYARYDESTATRLGELVELLEERWHGDLRRLHDAAAGDVAELQRLLQEFNGIGPVGAAIFLREAQGVWRDVRPFLDRRALTAAARLGLPDDPARLARLVDGDDLPRLAAALIRVDRARAYDEVRSAGSD